MVNELEMVGEELWANVYGTECLARIDKGSGSVTGWVLLHGLLDRERTTWQAGDAGSDAPDVLNGIAWDASSKRLFVTGKLWPHLYEIQVKPSQAWENSVRVGSSVARKGLSDDVITMLKCLEKTFPEEVSLGRVLGAKAPKKQRTVADDAVEILEASHYQEMPILPTSAEMIGHCAFEVQENMQTYEKCADYIQTHFMLLREDYIEPLRAGIKLFMQGRHSPKDLHVYTGVKVVGVLSTWEGLVYRIELRREEIRKVNWEKSKQLMYGSLLCFSDDDFKSLIWATVWRRDAALMSSKAQLDIRLPFDPWDDRLSPGKVFCCIENVTIYFEAYRHVLIALQNMRATDVPFQHTLLSPQPDPLPPTYLKEETDMFHFHNVFTSCEKADSEISAPKSFRILAEWPPALRQALDLDPSQLDAVQHALTHQMALIQGPPGTGKTFVGLKIVQAILDNTKLLRHSPVLVVCYTNHALDQFLEGIFKFCENIVRIGSRSKSEQMMRRNLKELVMGVPPSREFLQARKCLTDRRDYLRDELAKAVVQVDSHTVSAAQAKSLMSEQQFEEFYQGFLDYLGDSKEDFPEDAWVVDDEIWSRVMKEWLGTSDPSRFAPVPKHQGGGLPSFKAFGLTEESDEDDYAPYGSKDDGDEEEAANEVYDRKLDDNEQAEQVDEKRKSRMDFFQELHNAWLPYLDEYYENLTPEMRSLDWREENLWRLLPNQRRECYRQWLVEAHEEARGVLPELAHLLERNAESRAALERDRKLAVLREMQVVGMTTTAVSKYQQLLKELRPEVVIVEEAAEVLEAMGSATSGCSGDCEQCSTCARNGCGHLCLIQREREKEQKAVMKTFTVNASAPDDDSVAPELQRYAVHGSDEKLSPNICFGVANGEEVLFEEVPLLPLLGSTVQLDDMRRGPASRLFRPAGTLLPPTPTHLNVAGTLWCFAASPALSGLAMLSSTLARRLVPLAALVAGLLLCASPGYATVADTSESSQVAMPKREVKALAHTLREVDKLQEMVRQKGTIPNFGRMADRIVKRGLRIAGAKHGSQIEKALDAPLQELFHEQLRTLSARAADRYESTMAAKPNPVEARRSAEAEFVEGAKPLVRPSGGWSYEAELQDLLGRIAGSSSQDMRLVQEQGRQGQGKHVTLEVIRKLQQQSEAVQREVETRGAFPWKINWQYFVDNSPVGFRGQYSQGRSIVELLLLPSPDPRMKNNLLNKIGPLNLAVAFDMLL
ncbi:Znfx1 [Symbiodinium natans]|uniref:Znfx1 protein n=1 Tax=Symbiodinium natans TaxID=878477 RepID=A0A812QVW5_9DINO|nr:Znfx1 [Symbiodinium natans]